MFQLQIITLSGVYLDEEVFEVQVPTAAGAIAVNADHAPLVGVIEPGILTIIRKKGDALEHHDQVGVYEGTIDILNNSVKVLVDDVDTPDAYSEEEAKKALERAKEMTEKSGDAVALSEAQAMMDRSAVRLQLASLKKRSKR